MHVDIMKRKGYCKQALKVGVGSMKMNNAEIYNVEEFVEPQQKCLEQN